MSRLPYLRVQLERAGKGECDGHRGDPGFLGSPLEHLGRIREDGGVLRDPREGVADRRELALTPAPAPEAIVRRDLEVLGGDQRAIDVAAEELVRHVAQSGELLRPIH